MLVWIESSHRLHVTRCCCHTLDVCTQLLCGTHSSHMSYSASLTARPTSILCFPNLAEDSTAIRLSCSNLANHTTLFHAMSQEMGSPRGVRDSRRRFATDRATYSIFHWPLMGSRSMRRRRTRQLSPAHGFSSIALQIRLSGTTCDQCWGSALHGPHGQSRQWSHASSLDFPSAHGTLDLRGISVLRMRVPCPLQCDRTCDTSFVSHRQSFFVLGRTSPCAILG